MNRVEEGKIITKKLRKQKIYGILYSIVMIFVSIFWLGGNRLARSYERTKTYFYEIEGQLSISSQVDFIWGQGRNMYFLATRYDSSNILVQNLEYALSQLQSDTNFSNISTNLEQAILAISILHDQREILGLNNEDSVHFENIDASVWSAKNIISNSDFNNRAEVFNSLATTFPGNIIRIVRGIELLPNF